MRACQIPNHSSEDYAVRRREAVRRTEADSDVSPAAPPELDVQVVGESYRAERWWLTIILNCNCSNYLVLAQVW